MKKSDLERLLRKNGWRFVRHGGSHDVWEKGTRREAIPRHAEIVEALAKDIIRRQGLK